MKLLIIRGDLQAHSGYAAAARAYCAELRHLFERVVGVDIHFSARRPFEPFPFPLVSMAEARRLAEATPGTLCLSFTTPNEYLRLPHAVNVGLTFWECDQYPLDPLSGRADVTTANLMDAVWAPSRATKTVFRRAGVTVPIRVIPWPLPVTPAQASSLPEGDVYDLDRRERTSSLLARLAQLGGHRFRWSRAIMRRLGPRCAAAVLGHLRVPISTISRPAERTLLCVAQDVPRKALLLLLAEWLEFKRRPEAAGWSLLLKSTPYDPAIDEAAFVLRFWHHAQALKRQVNVTRADVFLLTADLGETDFERLVTATHGSVAVGLGEGFCGPVARALLAGKPVVAPCHTAFADYLAADYPFVFPTRPAHLRFVRDPLPVYHPLTRWQLPEPFTVADALSRLVQTDPATLTAVTASAQRRAAHWCNPARIRNLLRRETARLSFRDARREDVTRT